MRRYSQAVSRLPVQGTLDPHRPLPQHMGVNHGGPHIRMSQQFLDRADVLSCLEQVRCKAMPKGMTARRLQDPRLMSGGADGTLQNSLMLVMAHQLAGIRV